MSAVTPGPDPVTLARPSLRRSGLAYAPAWLVLAGLGAVLLAAGGIVTTVYTHDLYVVFDGGWRTYLGQRPYVDFRSPVGFVYFLPYVLLRAIEPFSLVSMMHANLVIATFFLLLATLTLPRRMSPLIFFLVTVGVVTTVISPRSADFLPNVFSHLAPYNRWSEGAMMVMSAVALLAPRLEKSARRDAASAPPTDSVGAAVLTLLALFLFHIKITYFLCSLGLVVLGLVTRQMSWRTVALGAALFAAGSALIELTLHLHRPYFEDLDMARRATLQENAGGIKFVNKRWGLFLAIAYSGATFLLLLLQRPSGGRLTARFDGWTGVLVVLVGGSIVGVAANTQTHQQWEIPLMGTVLLVIGELIQRRTPLVAVAPLRRILTVLLLIAGAGSASMVDSAAVVAHTIASRDGSTCPVPSTIGTPAERLLFARDQFTGPGKAPPACGSIRIDPATFPVPSPRDFHTFDSARLEVVRLSEAEDMLRGRQAHGERVIAMDFASPYSAFSGTLPAGGALLWWDFGRTYSESFHPDAQLLFNNMEYVLESLYDPRWEPHGSRMWFVYGGYVRRFYQPVAEGRFWRLWERIKG